MSQIFVSYSHRDSEVKKTIEALRASLQESGLSPGLLYDSFSDVTPGADWSDELISHLNNSSGVLVFLDPDSVNVVFESGYALGLGKPLLIVSSILERMPYALRRFQAVFMGDDVDKTVLAIRRWIDTIEQPSRQAKSPATLREILESRRDQNALGRVSANVFERAVAECFAGAGLSVELPSGLRDAGYDFSFTTPSGAKFIAEIKKRSPMSKISIADLRSVAGAAAALGFDSAMIVSLNDFTPSAYEFAKSSRITVNLIGPDDLERIAESPADWFANW